MVSHKRCRYLAKIIMDADYVDDLRLLANAHAQAKSFLHILEQAPWGICLYMNLVKTHKLCFIQDGAISSLNVKPLKLVDQFEYFGSNILSTESLVNICIVMISDKIGFLSSFNCVSTTVWMHHLNSNCLEKKQDGWLGFKAYQPL